MKKLSFLLSVLLLSCFLAGCAGAGDWRSRPLAGGYEIWRSSVHHITLCRPIDENSGETVIPAEIYAVSYNDDYLCVQWEPDEPDKNDYQKEPHGEISYYILRIADETLFGPLRPDAFRALCEQEEIVGLCDWVPVRQLPRMP